MGDSEDRVRDLPVLRERGLLNPPGGKAVFQLAEQLLPRQDSIREGHPSLLQTPGELCELRHIHPVAFQTLNLPKDLPGTSVHDESALVDHEDAVRIYGLFHIMSDQDNADLFPAV